MPAAQVIDTGEPDPKGVEKFFSNVARQYRDRQDKSTIDNLIGEYQKNIGDANAYEKLQLDLERSNIRPSKRLETQENLNKMQQVITQKKSVLNIQAKNALDEQRKQAEDAKKLADEKEKKEVEATKKANTKKEVDDILRIGGEKDEDVINAKSDYMSPETAKFEANKNLTKDLADKKSAPILGGTAAQKEIRTKVITPILEAGKNAKELLLSAKDYRNAIENLKKGSDYYKHILNIVPGGDKALENVLNADEQAINSITKKSIIGSGELKGLRLTDTKLRYIQGANPGPLKSYEANVAAYDIWLKTQKLLAKKADITNEFVQELTESGAKEFPGDFEAQLEERYEKSGLYDDAQTLADEAKNVPENKNVEKNTLDSLPKASEHKGKTIKDNKSGKLYTSNGKTWVPK